MEKEIVHIFSIVFVVVLGITVVTGSALVLSSMSCNKSRNFKR